MPVNKPHYSKQYDTAGQAASASGFASGTGIVARRTEQANHTNTTALINATVDTANNSAVESASSRRDSQARYRIPIALKMSAVFMLPLLIGMAVLAFIMIDTHRSFQHQQMDQFARVITEQLAASAVEPLFADANMELGVLINQISLDSNLIGAGIYNHLGEAIAVTGIVPRQSSIDLKQSKSIFPALEFLGPNSQSTLTTGQPTAAQTAAFEYGVIYSSPIAFRQVTGGYATVVFNEASLASHFDQMAYALIATSIVLFISLTVVIFLMSRHVTAPLKHLATAAANIDNGNIAFIPERRNDELGQLVQSINRMGKDLARKSEVEAVLEKFLAPDVANKIINELDDVNFRGENVEATVLFADIVGFTQISEQMTPEAVSEWLNEFFGYYSSCAKLYFGTVDKFLGDCVMIVFGAAKQDPKHQYNAVACARLMQELTLHINQKRADKGQFPVYLRIGINSGKMLAGLLGSQDRLEYTVVGDSVNLASRLCNEAKQGEVIIQEQCYDTLKKQCAISVDTPKTIKVRGKTEPVSIYNVTDIAQERSSANKAFIADLLR